MGNPKPDMAARSLWCVTCVVALTLVLNTVEADANNLGHDTNEGLSNEIFDASLTATTALDANKEVGEQTKAYQPSAAGREEEFGEDDEDDELAGLPSDHSASRNVKSSDQSGLGEANRLGTGSGEAAQGVKPIVGTSCLTIGGKKVDCSNRELGDQTIKYTIKQQPGNQAAIKRGTGRSRKRARQPSKRKRRAGHSKSKQSARRQRKRRA